MICFLCQRSAKARAERLAQRANKTRWLVVDPVGVLIDDLTREGSLEEMRA